MINTLFDLLASGLPLPSWICLLLTAACALGLLYYILVDVRPSERAVLIDRRGFAPSTVEAGWHFIPNLWITRLPIHRSPFRGFGKYPAPQTRLSLDPPPTQIHTLDAIDGTADIAVECCVGQWSASDVIRDSGDIRNRACNQVNQWVATQLALVAAEDITYGHMARFLNEPERLENLNRGLQECDTFLRALRVTVDTNGIILNQRWVQNRNEINQKRQMLKERENVLQTEAALERLERTKQQEQQDFELERKKMALAAAAERDAMQLEADLATKKRKIASEAETARLEAESAAQLQLMRAKADGDEQQVRVETFRAEEEAKSAAETARVQALLIAGVTGEQFARMAMAKDFLQAVKESQGTKLIAVPPGLMGLDWSKSPHAATARSQNEGFELVSQ